MAEIKGVLASAVHFAEASCTPDPMDFSLSDQQKLIRDTVRQFMENEVRPGVRQRDREARFPVDEIKKIA